MCAGAEQLPVHVSASNACMCVLLLSRTRAAYQDPRLLALRLRHRSAPHHIVPGVGRPPVQQANPSADGRLRRAASCSCLPPSSPRRLPVLVPRTGILMIRMPKR